MNVLFLTCAYPTPKAPGRGIFIKEHAGAIHRYTDHKLIMLAVHLEDGPFFRLKHRVGADEHGVTTHEIFIQTVFYKFIFFNPLFIARYVDRYFRKHIEPGFQPDVIHAHFLNPGAIIGHRMARAHGKPLLITEHWSRVDKFMKRKFFGSLGRKAYNDAQAITTVSRYLQENVKKYISDPSRMHIIPNVVSTAIFTYQPKLQREEIVFTAVATWTEPKQPHLFVAALNELQKSQSRKIVLNMVGEGPLLEEIESQRNAITIKHHGYVSKTALAALLHASDFFVHASRIETFSVVVAEALATGTPVIASATGALPELVHESNGVTTINDVQSWTAAISKALHTQFDHAAISAEVSEKFSAQKIAAQFDQVYSLI